VIDRYARPRMKAVWSEENKYRKWLEVELAVCRAWAEEGVIPPEDLEKILRNARFDPERIAHHFRRTRHDMTAFLRAVAEGLGPESRWVHLGLTSSDVMDTALALQIREAGEILDEDLADLEQVLRERALEFKDTLMVGRTHGVHAEPITFGLKLLSWWAEVRRDRERLREAVRQASYGKISGAVGTHATVPPSIQERACRSLGLEPEPLSTQVVPRDRHAHFLLTLALIAGSLERFATEIRHLQRTEVREVEEPFAEGQTGSSAMPHKRNPELSERICGLARLIRGLAGVSLENIALWHERDISHSSTERITLPDACMALDYILDLFTFIVRGMRVHPERMRANLEATRGLLFSQRVLLALVEKGLTRDQAYEIVQRNAMRTWDEGQDFRELLRQDPEVTAHLSPPELDVLFDYRFYTRYVDDIFRRAGVLG